MVYFGALFNPCIFTKAAALFWYRNPTCYLQTRAPGISVRTTLSRSAYITLSIFWAEIIFQEFEQHWIDPGLDMIFESIPGIFQATLGFSGFSGWFCVIRLMFSRNESRVYECSMVDSIEACYSHFLFFLFLKRGNILQFLGYPRDNLLKWIRCPSVRTYIRTSVR